MKEEFQATKEVHATHYQIDDGWQADGVDYVRYTISVPVGSRHNNGTNLAWADGHVTSEKTNKVMNSPELWNRNE